MPSTGQILRFCKPERYCKPKTIAVRHVAYRQQGTGLYLRQKHGNNTATTRQRNGNDMRQVYDIVKTISYLCVPKKPTPLLLVKETGAIG